MTAKSDEKADSEEFMQVLENGVRSVLGNRKSTAAEKLQAVTAGTKILAIRHKINGGDESSFFS